MRMLAGWACALTSVFVATGQVMAQHATESAAGDSLAFAVRIGNRMYPDWSEDVRVRLGEAFYLGDTELVARGTEYLPDFRIGDDGPLSASTDPNNPALHVIVFQDTTAVDSSWAFLNFPPHFSATSFFTFQLIGVEHPGAGQEAEPGPAPPGQ